MKGISSLALVCLIAFSMFSILAPNVKAEVTWSEDATNYCDNYLWCIQSKTGMPAPFIPEAVALMRCSSEKLANRTDGIVDVIDIRACEVTYMIDEGYYPGTYEDACAALFVWENACNVPYPIDCSEIVDFINANHEDIAAAIAVCEGTPPPVAVFTYTPIEPIFNETVTFNASASTPDGGTIVSYVWDFGDGTTGMGKIVTHNYTTAGNYMVVLNVTDSEGLSDTRFLTIHVIPEFPATLILPLFLVITLIAVALSKKIRLKITAKIT